MKIVILGSHGTGKTTLTRQLFNYLKEEYGVKIGITGSHGTGKTTLSKLLAGRLKWRYLPEAPAQALIKGFDLNENTSLESELWIIAKQLEMEMLTPQPWIADKCMIDILAYACYLFPKDKDLLSLTARAFKPHMNYDMVIYLPCGEFPIEDDGFRSTDPVFQEMIDEYILRAMKKAKIDFHKIIGSPEERFRKAKKLIDEKINR